MEDILKKFGQKLRDERGKKGLSQEELADEAGIHRTYVGMIERGQKNVTLKNLKKLAKALKLNLEELVKGL